MEFRVFPAGFNILPVKIPGPDGQTVDAMQLSIVDVSGTPVHFVFGGGDWDLFQRAVADPAGEAERQQARSRILAPGIAPAGVTRPRGR